MFDRARPHASVVLGWASRIGSEVRDEVEWRDAESGRRHGGVPNTVWATIISLTAPAMPSTPFLPRSGTTSALLIRWLKLLLFRNLFTFAITLQFNPARNPNSSRPTKERLVRFCREPCAAALPRRSLLLAPWPRSGAQTIPPDGPRRAARMHSSADEKAQISEVMPAKSRIHQLSALPIAGIAVAIVASE